MSNITILAARADGTYVPFSGEAWVEAGKMTFMGMLMVFAVLAILWGVLAIFKLIFAGTSSKAKTATPAPVKVEEKVDTVAQDESNDELIAVITAAVAAYRSEEGAPVADGSFRVVSFRRVGGGGAWNSK